MLIHAERAFWIIDFYRRSGKKLAFGGKIYGEEAACAAFVSNVSPLDQSIEIKLLADDETHSWDSLIDLHGATFLFVQSGDPEFAQFPKGLFHSVLMIGFSDGTNMFIAEQY